MTKKMFLVGLVCLFAFSCASFELGNLNPKARREAYITANLDTLSSETEAAIHKGILIIGMSADEVIASIGKPHDINETTGSWGVHSQWVMFAPNSSRDRRFYLVYFENGKVVSWQSK